MDHKGKFRRDRAKAGRKIALHTAAGKGDVQSVRLRLDHGAKSDLKDSLGRTPSDRAKLMN
jgi:ankyrin repeat protein